MNEITVTSQDITPAMEYHNWLLKLKSDIGEKFLMLGKLCRDINEGNLYKEHDCETFAEYLGEVGLDKSVVYRCINIYCAFVDIWGQEVGRLAPIGYSKLADIIPHVNDENHEELLVKAETLSRSDLIEELRGDSGTGASPNIVHCVLKTIAGEYHIEVPEDILKRFIKKYYSTKATMPEGE